MADVSLIVQLMMEDPFNPLDIITLTINGAPKSVSVTSYGWTTGSLTYADGLPLAIVVTSSPKYYEDASLNTTAIEGLRQLQLELVNPTLESIWAVGVRPTTLGRSIIKVDNKLWTDVGRLDDVDTNSIVMIDGVFISDGTWHIDVRDTDIGLPWEVTVTG